MITEQEHSPRRFDPFDPAFDVDPHPHLRRLREEDPVHWWEAAQAYVFFRYRDVMALLRDPRLDTDPTHGRGFSAELRARYPDYVALREHDLFMVGDAGHARIRKLISPHFTPRALEVHRPRVAAIIGALLDQLPPAGVINLFQQYARRYPVRVIASLLGVSTRDEDDFIALADAAIATLDPNLPPDVFAAAMPAVTRGAALVRRRITERRADPRPDDLLTLLIHACDDDDRLTDAELLSLVTGLLIGGADTTVHLTTYTLHELLRHPDQLALVRADPALVRLALDETMRFNGFGRGGGLVRFARQDFVYEGAAVRAGQPVFLNLMSALRDPEFVSDGDVYDIRRRTHSSPWFGHGAHFCVGASLARMEAELAVQRLLARYPRLELAGPAVYGRHPVLRDIVDLPVLLAPA